MKARFLLKVIGVLTGTVLAISVILIGVAVLTGKLTRPMRWQIPEGYRGWIVMEYGNPRCAPLKRQSIYEVLEISPSGRGCTSALVSGDWRYVRYEYFNTHGETTQLRTGWNPDSLVGPLSINREKKEMYLFVGTQEELRRSRRPD